MAMIIPHEDFKACGLVREGDSWWQPQVRLWSTVGKFAGRMATGGPVVAVIGLVDDTNKIYEDSKKKG